MTCMIMDEDIVSLCPVYIMFIIIKVSGSGVADQVEELQDRLNEAELLQKHGDLKRANEVAMQ